ncbi:MAG: rhodanese-like domain-containing protein [Gammaproteobacteria bacterium]|nr:rhodanese-like domain-containing protein [Gammaproteobacteria bacterium]
MFGFQTNSLECPEARKMVANGAQLVDVRSPQEFGMGAIPGSKNVPLQAIHTAEQHLDKSKPVIVYCASGMRSEQAKGMLSQMGFSAVHNLGSINKYISC